MRINDLFVENVEEAFKDMSQQATQIGANAAANAATAQRQQRITQLAQNQATRNASAPGRPLNRNTTAPASGTSTTTAGTPGASTAPPAAPAPATNAAPAQNTTAQPAAPAGQAGPTPDPTLNAPLPPTQPTQGRGFVKGLANVLGQTGKTIGAIASAPAGIGRAMKKGYAAGANAIGGPGSTPIGNTQVGNPTPSIGGTSGPSGSLSARLSNIERALGLSETVENGKYKLHFESKFLGQKI